MLILFNCCEKNRNDAKNMVKFVWYVRIYLGNENIKAWGNSTNRARDVPDVGYRILKIIIIIITTTIIKIIIIIIIIIY